MFILNLFVIIVLIVLFFRSALKGNNIENHLKEFDDRENNLYETSQN